MAKEDDIPRTKWARGRVLGGQAARLGLAHARQLAGQPFRTPAEQEEAELRTQERLATGMFQALAKLRGTALKLAQLLANEHELLPEALCRELARATHQAPALNRALARTIVTRELGRPEQIFASFETTPFAAASLGQVHNARDHTGTALAVKLQYPGMREGIDADLELMAKLLAASSYGPSFRTKMPALRARIIAELDYELEATQGQQFAEDLAELIQSNGLVIPQFYSEFTTKQILTSERLEGQHLVDFVKQGPPQELRDRIGHRLVQLFHHSLGKLGRLHADPNFGNYLFSNDGRIGLLDFGSILELDHTAQAAASLLFSPDAPEHFADQLRLLADVGITEIVESRSRHAFIGDWFEWLGRPFRCDRFDFAQAAEYFAEGAALGRTSLQFMHNCEPQFIYLLRCHHGLLRLLEALGARVQFHAG